MKKGIIVSLDSLGRCEHCGALITKEKIPSDIIAADQVCPECDEVLTERSFGCKGGKKILWVGPGGNWTLIKPNRNFWLGEWEIYVKPLKIY